MTCLALAEDECKKATGGMLQQAGARTLKSASSRGDLDPIYNTSSFDPDESASPNGISIGSAVFIKVHG